MNTKLFFFFILSLLFLGCPEEEPCTTCPTPLDTTSHTFSWQTFTWGGGGSSSINDVAIISENNIWAVGGINLPDSIAQDSAGHNRPRCIAHWDGIAWKLQYIAYMPPGSVGDSLSAIANSIYARNDHDIWLAAGPMFHYDGLKWTPIFNTGAEGATKIWGDNSGKLWCVGRNGTIVHYNSSEWQKVESGTTFNFQDIYGTRNAKTGEWEILALAAQYDTLPIQTQLLRIQGTTVTKIETFPDLHQTLWFVPGEKYYVAGNGILSKNSITDASWEILPVGLVTQHGTGSMRGTGVNDIFATGGYFDVVHYNGSTWHNYKDQITSGLGTFGRVALQGNTMVAGGYFDQDAILLLGTR